MKTIDFSLIFRKFVILLIFPLALVCAQESKKFTMEYVVDQIAQGFDPNLKGVQKNVDDSNNVISSIPSKIQDEVSAYLKGDLHFNMESVINENNYRDYLNAAKALDLIQNDDYRNTTYPIRLTCLLKSSGKLKTLEAFSFYHNPTFFNDYDETGAFLPNKQFELFNAGQFELIFVPEWIEVQKKIIKEAIKTIQTLSDQIGFEHPRLILFTGTYGSGKSYQVQHHRLTENVDFDPNALFKGVLGTDAIKRVYKALVANLTDLQQAHHEAVAIRLQIMKALFRHFSHLSFIQETVMSSGIADLLTLADEYNFKVSLIDLDVDLETACMRILTRDFKSDAIPPYRATVAAQKMVRANRSALQQKVQWCENIVDYELIYSEKNSTYLVAQKLEGGFSVITGQEERFAKALAPSNLAEVEAVANRIITNEDCAIYGDRLKPFVGMKIEDALLKLSS